MSDRLNLPYQIRKARMDAGLTQVELGKLIGASDIQISRFENGHKQLSISWLQKIADATNGELVVAIIPRPQPQTYVPNIPGYYV